MKELVNFKMTQVLADNYSPGIYMEMVEGFERWKDKTEHRPFLLSVLKERVPAGACVLDAAVGVGHDAIYLAKQGYPVHGNDIDKDALKLARKNAKRAGAKIVFTGVNWLDFRLYNVYYGVVLCLGNSLTYLFDKDQQLQALKNFRNKLDVPDCTLVIDERNYQYMFDHAREIERRRFRYPGVYALSKKDVHLTPLAIKEGEVIMRAASRQTGHTLDLKFYPFKRNEMLSLLRETGFRRIEQFSDYIPGFNPNADFYQYVCTK